ncbi:MAG TPA: double-strand break repair protein AddB [Devosiaceae bacterium]|nr:double-strand break repair protein AddB [Devosiaceae bacterium]
MRQSLFTIAPDAPFLKTLAAKVLDGTLLGDWPRTGPFWLADLTILLPTRRARLALAEEFLRHGHRLLPDIRTLGGEDEVEEPFLPPIDAPALPPPASRLGRRLTLARLIDAWARQVDGSAGFASPPSAAEIFRLADSLAGILDDLTIEGVDAAALRAIPPENLAENWQQTLQFLDIVLTAWPAILAGTGEADAAQLQNERLRRQAETVALRYGDRPVIAAGSTGSIPATAELIRAIARLPRGAVVLPGLDTDLPESDLALLADPQKAPHAHPQYGLVKLLQRLGVRPDAVTELAEAPAARTRLVRRALAPADATAGWFADRQELASDFAEALDGLSVLAAPGEDFEARAIAIAARDALEKGRTVGIVSPDRNIARRIAAELLRFDIEVDDAAGTPLFQSAAGRLARGALTLAAEKFAPVALMAVLRNRAVTLGLSRAELARLAELTELGLLRGQRPAVGIAGLRRTLADNLAGRLEHAKRRLFPADGEAIAMLLDRLEAAMAPLCETLAAPTIDAVRLALALARTVEAATAPAEGDTAAPFPGGDELRQWAEGMAGAAPGPSFSPIGLDAVLSALMAGFEVRTARFGRPDIAIWGRLEARLQHADLMILAALNEDVWPEPADPGPWLSRGMRLAAGLEPPERRQGQAAHDFAMAIGNREVLLAFASRRGTSPALPSPLLQRLEAFIGEAQAKTLRQKGKKWVEMARALDAVTTTRPATRPAPRPPASARPRKLSITEIETLFRSPYDIYARHVLKLRALDPLGEEPGARDRGTMIHEVFARFVIEGHDFAAPDALARLDAMAAEAFAGLESIGERRDIWLRRFSRAAELFLAFERDRESAVLRRRAEIKGEWQFPNLGGFLLTGRADRIDEMRSGGLEIIDFKTGGVPSPGAMKDFLAPQMPLEAAMARAGRFEAVPPADVGAMSYIKIGLGPEAFVPKAFSLRDGQTAADTADAVLRRLQVLVDALLLTDRLPMTAQVLPDVGKRYRGEFDHLARTEEWAVAEDEEP